MILEEKPFQTQINHGQVMKSENIKLWKYTIIQMYFLCIFDAFISISLTVFWLNKIYIKSFAVVFFDYVSSFRSPAAALKFNYFLLLI